MLKEETATVTLKSATDETFLGLLYPTALSSKMHIGPCGTQTHRSILRCTRNSQPKHEALRQSRCLLGLPDRQTDGMALAHQGRSGRDSCKLNISSVFVLLSMEVKILIQSSGLATLDSPLLSALFPHSPEFNTQLPIKR
jgi:hypothetical protein